MQASGCLYVSSTGGGAAIEVAAADPEVAAAVLVVPHVHGLSNFRVCRSGARRRWRAPASGTSWPGSSDGSR